jgi:GNAT superfamily N-acetyltransferase
MKHLKAFESFSHGATLRFKYSQDEDRIEIVAYLQDMRVGCVAMEMLFDPYEYEFSQDFTEDEFEAIFGDYDIVKVEYLKVEDIYRGKGYGVLLMQEALQYIKQETNAGVIYLNASPMGYTGLNTHQLVSFYQKFGFTTILDQGHNVQMVLVLQ